MPKSARLACWERLRQLARAFEPPGIISTVPFASMHDQLALHLNVGCHDYFIVR